jgi:hypothetical protein
MLARNQRGRPASDPVKHIQMLQNEMLQNVTLQNAEPTRVRNQRAGANDGRDR